ncbi:type II secretion system protein [Kineococcus glutinatus]|uniref:Prepilin-type N-terminal cleavage/methylation domain-containing protein n=1 Tax=Kineococcus glutinatus TaxID=1070872 RepID=A0ABP9HCI6_9ACTN
MRNRWWTPRHDDGFTLVEVIVALALLGVVATATLTFFIRATSSTSALQRKQAAVAVANSALDLARSVAPADLVEGRSTAAVSAQWAASTAPDLALTWPADDGSSPTATVQSVPITATPTVSGQPYSVSTLIGVCYRQRAAGTTTGTTSACTKPSGSSATTTPTGYVKVYRVVAEVTWNASGQVSGCSAGACVYRASTLIDANGDATWNVAAAPIANTTPRDVDAQTGTTTTPVDLQVLSLAGNVDADSSFVITSSSVTQGQLFVDGSAYNATSRFKGSTLTYAPQAGALGTHTLTYYILNASGQASEEATLTIRVIPLAVADTFTVGRNSTTTVNFGTNDKPNAFGSAVALSGSVALTSGSCTNISSDSSGKVSFRTPASTGTCVFSYQLKGATSSTSALVSDATTITVTVS